MTLEQMVNRAHGAEHFFTAMGMFFYAELVKEMREAIQKNRSVNEPR